MRTLLVVLTVAFMCVSCSKPKATRMNKLEVGMSKGDAMEIMGEPDTTKAIGKQTDLVYHLKDKRSSRTPYYIRIVDGKVTSFGQVGDYDSTKDRPDVVIENRTPSSR